MHPYGVRDVERLLKLPRSTIRALVAAGFVTPERGARNAWRFSFQDLIVLRTAQALAAAKVPNRRIARSMKELRRHLPESMPLSGLSIGAVADRVVVTERGARWQAESGQYLLEFGGDLRVVEPASVPEWFETALALERVDAKAALEAYGRVIAAEPKHLDARINMALLLHEAGRLAESERAYRAAIDACGMDAVLLFNLAVLLEDMKRDADAVRTYEAALHVDASLADAHYNLALLHEKHGRARPALRHMSQYRRLTSTSPHARNENP